MATIQEKIAGLYIAFFDRAGDQQGMEYWKQEANRLGEEEALSQLAAGFASHPKFSALYDHLSNQEFVAAIYTNILGKAGDSEGIAFWTQQLNSGMSRSDMVADFISISLDFNPNDPQYATLSDKEIETALAREALLKNKVALSLEFIHTLQEKTNLQATTNPFNSTSLDNDPAYKASIKVLKNITDNTDSFNEAEKALELLANKKDAIDIINSVEKFLPETIANAIENSTLTHLHHTNYGLEENSTTPEITKALDSGMHWHSQTVTYSFNHTIPESYQDNPALTENWQELNSQMQNSVISIMNSLNSFLNINMQFVDENGDIRYNLVDMDQTTGGFSFYPSVNQDIGGDVFLTNDFLTNPSELGITPGKQGYTTILHETGHALGLKHPFEGSNILPSTLDDTNHTVMSYERKENIVPLFTAENDGLNMKENIIYPNGYALYDIETLQSIYGRNSNTNLGNNTYSVQFNEPKIISIWDAGGEDTIDLSNTKGRTTIDLRGGTLNSLDEYSLNEIISYYQDEVHKLHQYEYDDWIRDELTTLYNNNELFTGKNNFGIPKGVIIENIQTGDGNDTIIDNNVDNSIITNSGNDNIYIGNGGFDYIDGGSGEDTLYLNLQKEQFTLKEQANNSYLLTTDNFGAQLVGIENLHLADNLLYNIEDMAV